MTSIPAISGLAQIANQSNSPVKSNIHEGEYKEWMGQISHRLEKYRHLATDPENHKDLDPVPSSSPNDSKRKRSPQKRAKSPPQKNNKNTNDSASASGAVSDEVLLQMTRREIEVLAAYHCELQKLIGDQNGKIDMMYDELGSTHEMAERLQVEVEKKTGGGVSPRRQAKMAMRQEIVEARRKIDSAHHELLLLQGELEGVRAEHSEVRHFISRQFFPVKQVTPEQKWPPTSENPYHHSSQVGGQFIIRPTKTAELREQIIADRRHGFVPGTRIKSTTYGITELSESRRKRRMSMSQSRGESAITAGELSSPEKSQLGASNNNNPPGLSWESYHRSAHLLKNIKEGRFPPSTIGHLEFKRKDISGTKKVINNSGSLSQSRNSNNNNTSSESPQNNNNSSQNNANYRETSASPGSAYSMGGTTNSNPQHHSNGNRARSPGSISTLSQEKSVFSKKETDRPPFKGISLISTTPTSTGIIRPPSSSENHEQ